MPPPERLVISHICESFSCTPSQAERELERDPELVFEILQLRAYADVYRQFERATKIEEQPQGRLAQWYRQITFDLHRERHGGEEHDT